MVGSGRGARELEQAGGPHTELLGWVDDAELGEIIAGARALLFPGVEDFGMVPVEVQAAGVPVIAYADGGARDSVADGVTGILYDKAGVQGLCDAIERFEQLEFDEAEIRRRARGFDPERFRRELSDLLLTIDDGRSQ